MSSARLLPVQDWGRGGDAPETRVASSTGSTSPWSGQARPGSRSAAGSLEPAATTSSWSVAGSDRPGASSAGTRSPEHADLGEPSARWAPLRPAGRIRERSLAHRRSRAACERAAGRRGSRGPASGADRAGVAPRDLGRLGRRTRRRRRQWVPERAAPARVRGLVAAGGRAAARLRLPPPGERVRRRARGRRWTSRAFRSRRSCSKPDAASTSRRVASAGCRARTGAVTRLLAAGAGQLEPAERAGRAGRERGHTAAGIRCRRGAHDQLPAARERRRDTPRPRRREDRAGSSSPRISART